MDPLKTFEIGPAQRRELSGWCALAIGALAIAGVFALLLALSRTPGVQDMVPWPLEFFRKALVIHVIFAFVIWFLAVFGAGLHLAVWQIARDRPQIEFAGRFGLLAVAVACVLLFVPALLDRGEPTLNNYIPAIIDPVYYLGLGVLAVGLALPVFRLLVTPFGRPMDTFTIGVACAAATFLLALICFGLALNELAGEPPSYAFNEELFWGGGHMLQFLSTLLLIGAWSVLARIGLGEDIAPRYVVLGAMIFLVICALPAPFLYFAYPPFSAEQTSAFSGLLWALGPPTLVLAVFAGRTILRRRNSGALPWSDPAFLCLVLSIVVFGVGGVLGMFIDGTDTRTPAHYHGVIAGVTLAFMGLFFTLFLPLLGRTPKGGRAIRFLVWAFAGGQTLASLGLFLAGGYGVPRKVAGDAQGLEEMGAIVGMAMNGVGALVAVVGGVMFIWICGRALLSAVDG
ncbi:MAG: cbb3-type cytochrome c oxidase subunit I [Rhodospirillales bacterium]|nr:cbb3-type cytochrome c oxidase subunit I [Rhodospirillales bacterium]